MGTYAKFKRAILKGILAGFLLSLVAGPILTTFIPLVLAQQHDFEIEAGDDPEGISVSWDSNPTNMRGFRVFRGTDGPESIRSWQSGHWDPRYTGPIVTDFLDLNTDSGVTYWYKIQLLDGEERVIATSNVVSWQAPELDGQSDTDTGTDAGTDTGTAPTETLTPRPRQPPRQPLSQPQRTRRTRRRTRWTTANANLGPLQSWLSLRPGRPPFGRRQPGRGDILERIRPTILHKTPYAYTYPKSDANSDACAHRLPYQRQPPPQVRRQQ